MARSLRSRPDKLWQVVHAIDGLNAALFAAQEQLKREVPPEQVVPAWELQRDILDRAFQQLFLPERKLVSQTERAYAMLRAFLEGAITSWDLPRSQKERLELQLLRAERERLGAEAAAA